MMVKRWPANRASVGKHRASSTQGKASTAHKRTANEHNARTSARGGTHFLLDLSKPLGLLLIIQLCPCIDAHTITKSSQRSRETRVMSVQHPMFGAPHTSDVRSLCHVEDNTQSAPCHHKRKEDSRRLAQLAYKHKGNNNAYLHLLLVRQMPQCEH
jgi:hypothetical protein